MNSTKTIVPFNFYGDNLDVVKEGDTLTAMILMRLVSAVDLTVA